MAEEERIVPKQLDPESAEFKQATLKMLIADAVARKNKKAFEFLQTESAKKENRTRNGVTTKVNKNIASIRAEYAKKYMGYRPNSKKASEAARKRKQEKAEQERLALFEEASKLFD